MGIGTSVFLTAAGAVLDFAVHPTNTHGFNLNAVGVILMAVGAIGLILSLLFWNSWGSFGRGRTVVRDRYVDDGRL